MRLYGNTIERFELRKGDAGMAPNSKPDFIGTVNIYINDQAAFDAAGKRRTQTLVNDVPHFSSVNPTAFPTVISRPRLTTVTGTHGGARLNWRFHAVRYDAPAHPKICEHSARTARATEKSRIETPCLSP